MKSLEKKLKYYDLFMQHDLMNINEYSLPKNYHFVYFKDGDELEWVNINIEAGVFLSVEEGLNAFNRSFGVHYEMMKDRCIFIENEFGEKVATTTAYFYDDKVGKVHWVAIKKKEQGNKLSKPLLSKILMMFKEMNYECARLHTQTHNWLAIKVYLDMGFMPYEPENRLEGWNIIKTVTNHKSLDNFNNTDIYDPLFIEIENFIEKHYQDYEYKVYDDYFKVKANNQVYTYNIKEISTQ